MFFLNICLILICLNNFRLTDKNKQKLQSKNIYLIRHGQTKFNQLGRVQGSGIDAPLNETGKKQSHAFFEAYKHIPFDKVYTSVLQRSIQSIQGFLDLGIPHQAYEELNEIHWGNREGQLIDIKNDKEYQTMMNTWLNGGYDAKIGDGESPRELKKKQQSAMKDILSRKDERNILVCMHGRAMRILMCWMLGYELKQMDMFHHENLCLYLLHYAQGTFTVNAFNDTQHLLT